MPETQVLEVPGIKCEGCAETITAVVKSLTGVHDVAVDAVRKEVTVTFDSGFTSLDAIQSQIRLAGF